MSMLEDMSPQERLARLFQHLTGKEPEYEPLAALSSDQQKEWDAIDKLSQDALSLGQEAEARCKLFWIKVRRALGLEGDRDGMKIDNGVVFGTKREKKDKPEGLETLEDPDSQ